MTNWVRIENSSVILIHHSTSAIIEVIFKEDGEEKEEKIFINYYQLGDLKNAILETEN